MIGVRGKKTPFQNILLKKGLKRCSGESPHIFFIYKTSLRRLFYKRYGILARVKIVSKTG